MRILAGVASGRTYREIAPLLDLAPKTVKNQGLVLLRKLSPESRRAEALGRFVELVPPQLKNDPKAQERSRILASLTEHDQSLLTQIGQGYTDREIGDANGMAVKSIKNMNHSLFVKLGATNRDTATMFWLLQERTKRMG
jgi:DNA-binding NarL/FixJ family response regulator